MQSVMKPKPAFVFRQSGVIPYRWNDGAIQVLLITSMGGKRWIVPKGIVERDLGPLRSAALEAFEEAGATGVVAPTSIGRYCYQKWGGTCQVEVFSMEVATIADDWPERDARQREWVSVPEALARLGEPGLKALIAALPDFARHRPDP